MKQFMLILSVSVSLLSVCISFSSCNGDDEEPVPIRYFELEVDASYDTEFTDNWIILHDHNGAILDVTPFESGQHLAFDKAAIFQEKIGVTLLQRFADSGLNYSLQSFLSINPKDKWTLKVKQGAALEYLGDLTVIIDDPNIGHQWDTHISSPTVTLLPESTSGQETFFSPLNLYAPDNDFFIFTTDKELNPLYKFVENAQPGTVKYSLDEFSDFDKTVNINFPESNQHFLIVQAFETADASLSGGVVTNFRLKGLIEPFFADSYKVGYLDRFTFYRTEFHAFGQSNINYEAFGPAPTADLTLTNQFNISVSDPSFQRFAVSSTDFDWRMSSWFFTQGTFSFSWIIRSDQTHLKNLQELPEIILTKYPELQINKLVHGGTTFYKGTRSYDQFIDSQFKGASIEPYELMYVTTQ